MNGRRFLYLAGVLVGVMLLLGGMALAKEAGPEGPQNTAEAVSTAFTYQGELKKGSSHVSDTCDMRFRLYDAASAGAQVGSEINASVPITNGLFTVVLNESGEFGDGAFIGSRRWLGVEVKCTGESVYTDLGRQELTAVPYAFSLRPGAVISGTNASGSILHVENTGGGTGSAVYAKSSSGYAVHGESKASYGVYAAGAGGDLGLYDGSIYAVRESGSDMTLYSNDDVYVHLDNDNSNPVKIYSEFQIINGNGTTVFSVAENGAVSWYTQTGYVSIPAAAFRPREDGYDFRNLGTQVINDDDNSDEYYAPVQLPHGATVTKITFYYSDSSASNASVTLRRTEITSGASTTMASVNSVGSSGLGHTETTAIDPDTIDNSAAAYFLRLVLPNSSTIGIAVLIEYAYTGPY